MQHGSEYAIVAMTVKAAAQGIPLPRARACLRYAMDMSNLLHKCGFPQTPEPLIQLAEHAATALTNAHVPAIDWDCDGI